MPRSTSSTASARDSNLVLRRRKLTPDETASLDDRIRRVALDLIVRAGGGPISTAVSRPSARRSFWTTTRCSASSPGSAGGMPLPGRPMPRVISPSTAPLPFLPPECQNAVVVQATLEPRNGGSFGLAAAGECLVRSPDALDRHAREVAGLWGDRLLQARGVYLADGGVLHQPSEHVAAYLECLGRIFPIREKAEGDGPRFDGFHMFLDDFRGVRAGLADWGGFLERGLIRLSLGIESGALAIRAGYRKDWSDDDLRAVVADAKLAGLGLSVLTLVGAGGRERAGEHVEQTARLIASLSLDRGDFVFLLDERELGLSGVESPERISWRGEDWDSQQRTLKETLGPLKRRGIKVLPYTMEKQWM